MVEMFLSYWLCPASQYYSGKIIPLHLRAWKINLQGGSSFWNHKSSPAWEQFLGPHKSPSSQARCSLVWRHLVAIWDIANDNGSEVKSDPGSLDGASSNLKAAIRTLSELTTYSKTTDPLSVGASRCWQDLTLMWSEIFWRGNLAFIRLGFDRSSWILGFKRLVTCNIWPTDNLELSLELRT